MGRSMAVPCWAYTTSFEPVCTQHSWTVPPLCCPCYRWYITIYTCVSSRDEYEYMSSGGKSHPEAMHPPSPPHTIVYIHTHAQGIKKILLYPLNVPRKPTRSLKGIYVGKVYMLFTRANIRLCCFNNIPFKLLTAHWAKMYLKTF